MIDNLLVRMLHSIIDMQIIDEQTGWLTIFYIKFLLLWMSLINIVEVWRRIDAFLKAGNGLVR